MYTGRGRISTCIYWPPEEDRCASVPGRLVSMASEGICKHGKKTGVYRNNQFITGRILSSNSSGLTEHCRGTWMAISESDLSYFPRNHTISTYLDFTDFCLSPLTVTSFCIAPGSSGPRYTPRSVPSPAAGETWTQHKVTWIDARIYLYVKFLHYILELSSSNQMFDHVKTEQKSRSFL